MESLLDGKYSGSEDLESEEDELRDDIGEISEDDGADHDGLLEAIGVKRRDSTRKSATFKLSEYQTISNDGRGELPTFRGIKALRKDKKLKDKKQTKKQDVEEEDPDDLMEEVEDDPTVTKPALERSKRGALYENVKKDVSKWNSVVYHNRVAGQLVFPLRSGEKISKRSIKDSAEEFVPQTPLEEEMAKILYGEDYVARKKAELHSKEGALKSVDEKYSLSVEEALERHKEMARLRALQSYEMAKAKRKNKIKSKKYHRLMRRDKIKKQMKEFEELKLKDPEAAMAKLEELDASRIKERMTLKHRNTSKWAKSHAARAKYDKNSRIALAEQLKIAKELTQKKAISSDESDTEDEGHKADGDAYQIKDFNVNHAPVNDEELTSRQPARRKLESLNLLELRSMATPETSPSVNLSLTAKSTLINPRDFLVINPKFNAVREVASHKELLEDESDADQDDGEEDQRMVIAEAFEDDDIISDFQKKKSDEIEASKPKDIDLTLPGWGDWGGKGVQPSKPKQKRFIKKARPAQPRKDARLSHVIINEKANAKLREHQVRQLPFPFKRVADFEKTIRAPIGRHWIPETAMKKLTAPKVITRLGTVIKPIDEELLVKKKTGSVEVVGGVPTSKSKN